MTSILGNEWHLSSIGNVILTENGAIKDKQQVYNIALNTELKEICVPVLHEFKNNETPKTILQIHKIRNISAPKANEDSQAAPRLLKLTLTDGETYIQALELSTIGTISLKNTPPGTKLLIEKAEICSGYILLSPQNCKVLGGKVDSLIEKWEVTRSVQRNRRNNNNNNEDGPPPWVNFGTKIKAGIQENNFTSLSDKSREFKEASEFDQQRQDAILEASAGAVRKVFSGRVRQSVQIPSANNRKYPEKSKELGKIKGKTLVREKEVDERPQKPSEKVSLFAFLEDKLPVSSNQEGQSLYSVQPTKNTFKEIESSSGDQGSFDHKRRKAPLPKQFEKPDYKKTQGTSKPEYFKKENSHFHHSSQNSVDSSQKKSNSSVDNSITTPRQPNYNNQSNFNSNDKQKYSFNTQQSNNFPRNYTQNFNYNTNDQYKQKHNTYMQQNYSYPQSNRNYPLYSNDQYNSKPNPYPHDSNHDQYKQNNPRSANTYSPQPNYYPQNNQQPIPVQKMDSEYQNANNFNKRSYQKPNSQIDVNHITQEVQKMALNSQFATRSLRQHLNLGEGRRNEDGSGNSCETGGRMNVGDEIMAKYWEDGKYYNATIISITDKTFAVKFKGYGNIEEILKTDCHPMSPSNNRGPNFNQQSNRPYSGTVEFRRRNNK